MDFRRSLSLGEATQWDELVDLIKEIKPVRGADRVSWALEKSGHFSTKSMYRMLAHRGVINYRMRMIWKCKVPLKVKVFLWQTVQNKLQTAANLKERNWKGSHKCVVCGENETEDHIFFSCILAKFIWQAIREALGWERAPTGVQDFMDTWLCRGSRNPNLTIFCLAAVLWSIWLTRNKYAIEGVFPNKPTDMLFKIFTVMQRWQVLLKGEEKEILEARSKTLRSWLEDFSKKCKDDYFM